MAIKTINDLDLTPPDNFDDLQLWLVRNFGILQGIASAALMPIWAERGGALTTGLYQWAFGNGQNNPANFGIPIYVPINFSCEIVAMSLSIGIGTATVEVNLSGVDQGSNADVSVSIGTNAINKLTTPLSVVDGDILVFKTTIATGVVSGVNQVCAWLRTFPTVAA